MTCVAHTAPIDFTLECLYSPNSIWGMLTALKQSSNIVTVVQLAHVQSCMTVCTYTVHTRMNKLQSSRTKKTMHSQQNNFAHHDNVIVHNVCAKQIAECLQSKT